MTLREHRGRSGTWVAAAIVTAALAFGVIGGRHWLLGRGDGAAIIVIVEDGAGDERRADAILLARWWPSCDKLTMTSVPRDLVVTADGVQLSVLHDRAGSQGLADLIEDTFSLGIAASITMSVDDVKSISADVGPIPIELPALSRDLLTGFHGGPGVVELDGERAVAFLRSRHWEEFGDNGWKVVDVTDSRRIDRLHDFLAAAAVVKGSGTGELVDALTSLARNSDIAVADRVAAAGIFLGVGSVESFEFDVVPTRPERGIDDRRSPFEQDHLGAVYREVLDGSFIGLPDGCAVGAGP